MCCTEIRVYSLYILSSLSTYTQIHRALAMQSMAVSAAGNAATAGAAVANAAAAAVGAAAAGAATAGTLGGAVSSMAAGFAGASAGVQVGVVVGTVTTISASVVSGTVVGVEKAKERARAAQMASAVHTGQPSVSEFPSVAPSGMDGVVSSTEIPTRPCGVDADVREGNVMITMQGFPRALVGDEIDVMERIFATAYNTTIGGCDDVYQRFMHNATLQELNYIPDGKVPHLETTWTAFVQCRGCPAMEPLFSGESENDGRKLLQDQPGAMHAKQISGVLLSDRVRVFLEEMNQRIFESKDSLIHLCIWDLKTPS